jgi:hypothetical protein
MTYLRKRQRLATGLAWFLLVEGGGIAFSGCDEIEEFLGIGLSSEDDPAAEQPQQHPKPEEYIAEGGDSQQLVLDGGQWYEAHIFNTNGTASLVFTGDPAPENIVVDVLVVAGGGGAGGTTVLDKGGGGGAGGGCGMKPGKL